MMLPFGYATRNLMRDRARLLQTLAGSALVVLLVMGAYALNDGMARAMRASGSPRNVMLLGAGSEESVQRSEVSEQAAGIAEASIAGVFRRMDTRAVSPEIYHMAYFDFPEHGRGRGMIRGVTARALLTHPSVSVVEGHFPQPGEVLVGRMAYKAFGVPPEALAVGRPLIFDGVELTVSGTLANPGTVTESEIWMDLNELRTLAQRDSVSAVVVRLEDGDPGDVDLFTKQRFDLELVAITEEKYFEKLVGFYAPVRAMTWITAALISISAIFGGLNTLYAAFAARIREIATLQAMGYRPLAIVISFIQESLMASLLGTLIGALIAAAILSGRVVSLSAGAFTLSFEPETLYVGLLAGTLLGLVGALPPAVRCLKPPLPSALRDSG